MNGSVVLPLHETSFPYQKTAGVLLREARELKGLSQEQVASSLNLMASHILAMESDAYNPHLEGRHFATYIKSYARLVDLNPQILLGLYQGQVSTSQSSNSFPQAEQRRSSSGIFVRLFTVGVLLTAAWAFTERGVGPQQWLAELQALVQPAQLAGGASAPAAETSPPVWTTPEWAKAGPSSATEPGQVSETAAAKPSAAPQPAASTDSLSARAAELAEPVLAAGNRAPGEDAVKITPSDATYQAFRVELAGQAGGAQATGALVDDILLFNFHDSCWVEVYDAQQNPIVMDTKLQGESLRITGKAPFEVRVGNSRAVSLSLNGTPVPIEVHPTIDSTELIVGQRS